MRDKLHKKLCVQVSPPNKAPPAFGVVTGADFVQNLTPAAKDITVQLSAPSDAFWRSMDDPNRDKTYLPASDMMTFHLRIKMVDESEVTHEAQCTALRQTLSRLRPGSRWPHDLAMHDLAPFLFPHGNLPSDEEDNEFADDATCDAIEGEERVSRMMGRLIETQRRAVRLALSQRVTVIQGPPGTGKTHTAAAICMAWIVAYPEERCLAVADSNAAADNLCIALRERGVHQMRVGAGAADQLETMTELPLHKEWLEARNERIDKGNRNASGREKTMRRKMEQEALHGRNIDVIVTTCVGSAHASLKGWEFERVIVDECTQSVQPSSLIPVQLGCRQLVLVGDHKQLPPTLLHQNAENSDYAVSLFEHIISRRERWSVMLDVQRRMHPSISAFPNAHFYGGKLSDGVNTMQRGPCPGELNWPSDSHFVALVDVQSRELTVGTSHLNHQEAQAVKSVVDHLLGRSCNGDQIGVITPYLAQKQKIIDVFENRHKYRGIKIHTVDGFQGSERDVMVFSAVRANPWGGLGFLQDPRRVNVMLTRAKRGLVVIGNARTMEAAGKHTHGAEDGAHGLWPTWVAEQRRLNCVTILGKLVGPRVRFTGTDVYDGLGSRPFD